MVGEEAFVVEVAEEGVPEVAIEGAVEVGDCSFFEIIGFVCLKFEK